MRNADQLSRRPTNVHHTDIPRQSPHRHLPSLWCWWSMKLKLRNSLWYRRTGPWNASMRHWQRRLAYSCKSSWFSYNNDSNWLVSEILWMVASWWMGHPIVAGLFDALLWTHSSITRLSLVCSLSQLQWLQQGSRKACDGDVTWHSSFGIPSHSDARNLLYWPAFTERVSVSSSPGIGLAESRSIQSKKNDPRCY